MEQNWDSVWSVLSLEWGTMRVCQGECRYNREKKYETKSTLEGTGSSVVTNEIWRKKEKKPNNPRGNSTIWKMNNINWFLDVFLYLELLWYVTSMWAGISLLLFKSLGLTLQPQSKILKHRTWTKMFMSPRYQVFWKMQFRNGTLPQKEGKHHVCVYAVDNCWFSTLKWII